MAVAEVFADHGGVFAFHQGVVIGMPRSELSELPDVQFVQQRGDLVVDVFGAVVIGVEALDGKTAQGMACCQGAVRDPVRRAIRADGLEYEEPLSTQDFVQAPLALRPATALDPTAFIPPMGRNATAHFTVYQQA